jgi:hypothetical protein
VSKYFYNDYHLGDCVFHIHFLRKLTELIDDNIIFHVADAYVEELKKHVVDKPRIQIRGKTYYFKDPGLINCHINAFGNYGEIFAKANGDYAECYVEFFKRLCEKHNLPNPIRTKFDMLWDSELSLASKIPTELDGEIDYFVVNAPCYSGQFLYNPDDFSRLFEKLSKKSARIVCTHPAGAYNIPATMSHGLSLVEIARIASQSKHIVGIHTAPMIPCLNVWNIQTTEEWSLFSERETYFYNNRIFQWKSYQEFIERTKI